MKTSAVVFTRPGQVELAAQEVGSPGAHQLLIRTEKSLISSGTELTALGGDFRPGSAWAKYVTYPHLPGYSNIGRVKKVGAGVKRFKTGDLVAAWAPHAGVVLTDESRVEPVPAGVKPEQAAFFAVAQIVLNGIRLAGVEVGEAAVVLGAGLLGQMAVQLLSLAGAFPIICIDLLDGRLATARFLGAGHTVNPSSEDPEQRVTEMTRGRKADVLFEITGSPEAIPLGCRLVRRLGKVVLLGSTRGSVEIDFHDQVHWYGLKIIGAHVTNHPELATSHSPWTRSRNAELYFDLLQHHMLDVIPLLSGVIPWQEAPQAYARLKNEKESALSLLLDWSA
jgi:2-desacetyl-2-hydroxyethyl bacteriochlorophyllide A dehydrogenase